LTARTLSKASLEASLLAERDAVAQGVFLNEAARRYDVAPFGYVATREPLVIDPARSAQGPSLLASRVDGDLQAIVGVATYFPMAGTSDAKIGAHLLEEIGGPHRGGWGSGIS
jgi:hypothetical protein